MIVPLRLEIMRFFFYFIIQARKLQPCIIFIDEIGEIFDLQ